MADAPLKAAYEEADITPPLGGSMPGYFKDRQAPHESLRTGSLQANLSTIESLAMKTFPGSKRRSGFTLVELLVVVAIIAVLIALLLPAVQKVRESASRTRCQNSLHQIGIALHNYHSQQGHLPLGTMNPYGSDGVFELDRRTWFQELLPFVEQHAVWEAYHVWSKAAATQPLVWANGMWNAAPLRWARVPNFNCPTDPNAPKMLTSGAVDAMNNNQGWHGNYVLCAGSETFNPNRAGTPSNGSDLNGLFFFNSRIRFTDIADGTANTLMGSEILLSPDINNHDTRGRYWNNARQGGVLFSTRLPPNTSQPDRLNWCQSIPRAPCTRTTQDISVFARSMHGDLVNAMLADGSVRTIHQGVNPTVYNALGSRAGGETAGEF